MDTVIGDADYLKELSGRKQKTAIIAWCKLKGIHYFLNADGWPVTTAAALDRALEISVESGPNWNSRYYAPKKTKAPSESSP